MPDLSEHIERGRRVARGDDAKIGEARPASDHRESRSRSRDRARPDRSRSSYVYERQRQESISRGGDGEGRRSSESANTDEMTGYYRGPQHATSSQGPKPRDTSLHRGNHRVSAEDSGRSAKRPESTSAALFGVLANAAVEGVANLFTGKGKGRERKGEGEGGSRRRKR